MPRKGTQEMCQSTRYGNLDLDYLNKWVVTLGIEEMWKGLQDEAETI